MSIGRSICVELKRLNLSICREEFPSPRDNVLPSLFSLTPSFLTEERKKVMTVKHTIVETDAAQVKSPV